MSTWMKPLEEARQGPGHWHIEGHCAFRMGRTWVIKETGCQAIGTDNPKEMGPYRSSLNMVREYIRTQINN